MGSHMAGKQKSLWSTRVPWERQSTSKTTGKLNYWRGETFQGSVLHVFSGTSKQRSPPKKEKIQFEEGEIVFRWMPLSLILMNRDLQSHKWVPDGASEQRKTVLICSLLFIEICLFIQLFDPTLEVWEPWTLAKTWWIPQLVLCQMFPFSRNHEMESDCIILVMFYNPQSWKTADFQRRKQT